MKTITGLLAFLTAATALASPQTPTPGDARRIAWSNDFEQVLARAKETGRPILCKPILGGSNKPDPDGVPCGGKQDCEGSW
jgi:hypothetical protein